MKYLSKILVFGSTYRERTQIIEYFTGFHQPNSNMTIGVDFSIGNCILPNHDQATLQIWNFYDQDRFRFMVESYCMGAKGAILLFDPTRPDTFYSLKNEIDRIRNNTRNISIILVETKKNGVDEDYVHSIPREDIDNFIYQENIMKK
jgi:GTPase SAR1 family protein